MYYTHFGLTAPPFGLTPQTNLYYPSEVSQQVMLAVTAALERGDAILKVTGEVGTGKTLICRMLLESLTQQYHVAYIAVPAAPTRLYDSIAAEFGLQASTMPPLAAIQEHLLALHAKNQRAVLVIDEAQALGVEGLEAVRLLSNLETASEKLIQIILFGQPELDDLLERHELRQLRQRIVFAFRTAPLCIAESIDYVQYRLARVASSRLAAETVFSHAALKKLAKAGGGNPRVLNLLADKALLAAYAAAAPSVTPTHANMAIAEQTLPPAFGAPSNAGMLLWFGMGLIAFILLKNLLLSPATHSSLGGLW